MGNVMSKFLMPLKKVFPLPKNAEGHEDQFFESYFMVLKTFDDITLGLGAEHVIATRIQRTFPLPAECNLACSQAVRGEAVRARQEDRQGNRHEHMAFDQRYPEWQDHRIKRANDLVQCDMGREAHGGKWIVALHDFCRLNGRLPDRHEVLSVKNRGIQVQKDFEFMVESASHKNDFNMLIVNCIELRKAMFGRLGNVVNGKA